MDSLFSAAQIVVEYDRVDTSRGGDSKLIKKLLKAKTFQKPKKFAKTISLEEPSFLTLKTRLSFIKIGSKYTTMSF